VDVSVARAIQQARNAKGMSQKDLATVSDVEQNALPSFVFATNFREQDNDLCRYLVGISPYVWQKDSRDMATVL
jgi:transcriptional regulator with XRE-family HTH domain